MEEQKYQWIGEEILDIKLEKENHKLILESIKLKINTLSDGIKYTVVTYQQNRENNPNGQKKIQTLESCFKCLKEACKTIKNIKNRSWFSKMTNSKNDTATLKECDYLVKNAIKLITQKENQLIEQVLGKDIKNMILNQYKDDMNDSHRSEYAQDFWSNHIGLLHHKEKLETVINKFYDIEFIKLREFGQIKKDQAIIKLTEYLNKDGGDGDIGVDEFNAFYNDIWSKPQTKKQIVNEILEEQDQPLKNNNQIMSSILQECNLSQYLTKFMSLGLNSRSFLRLDNKSLQEVVPWESAIKIYDAIQSHNDSLQKFQDIKQFLISVRDYAYGIRQRYLANPKDWEKDFTGVCKLRWCICEAFKGKIYGPYIRDDEISYGFIVSWDPEKNYNPLNQYIANFGEPSQYKYKRLLMETYSYWDRDNVYTYQQVSNFEEAFVIKKKFDKEDEDYIRPYAHGPTLYRDKQGNQARIYFYQNHEMSYKEYKEKVNENYMYPKFKKVTYKY